LSHLEGYRASAGPRPHQGHFKAGMSQVITVG